MAIATHAIAETKATAKSLADTQAKRHARKLAQSYVNIRRYYATPHGG
jgi:hypothetical protein